MTRRKKNSVARSISISRSIAAFSCFLLPQQPFMWTFLKIPPFSWQEFNWALMITCFLRTSIKSWNSVRSGRWFVSRKSTQFSFDGTGKIDGFDWTVETCARCSAAAERCERVNVPLDELSIEWMENDSTFHSARKRSTEHFRRFRCGDGETAENLKKLPTPWNAVDDSGSSRRPLWPSVRMKFHEQRIFHQSKRTAINCSFLFGAVCLFVRGYQMSLVSTQPPHELQQQLSNK